MEEAEEVEAVGVMELAKLLRKHAKEVCEKDQTKAFIVVGVIGQPNVGKQTLINTLKKERVKVDNAD